MNTRFNPSCNGALHLGHIYTMLINEQLAHTTGGTFSVRMDDTSLTTQTISNNRLADIVRSQLADMEWLRIRTDTITYQSGDQKKVRDKLEDYGYVRRPVKAAKDYKMPYSVRMGNRWIPYPYDPNETAERVVYDYLGKITHLIRGEEFLTEFSLYCLFCEDWNINMPDFVMIPRLVGFHGEDISKTNGGYTIAELRHDGYTQDFIKDMLADSCLEVPPNGWTIHNLKREPRITIRL